MEKVVPRPVGPGPNVHKGGGPEPAPLWLLWASQAHGLRKTMVGRMVHGTGQPKGAGKAARAESLASGEFARPAAGRQAAQPWPNG